MIHKLYKVSFSLLEFSKAYIFFPTGVCQTEKILRGEMLQVCSKVQLFCLQHGPSNHFPKGIRFPIGNYYNRRPTTFLKKISKIFANTEKVQTLLCLSTTMKGIVCDKLRLCLSHLVCKLEKYFCVCSNFQKMKKFFSSSKHQTSWVVSADIGGSCANFFIKHSHFFRPQTNKNFLPCLSFDVCHSHFLKKKF